MRYRMIYRICLLAVILITLVGGIFYYTNYVDRQTAVTEGTLVRGNGAVWPVRSRYAQRNEASRSVRSSLVKGNGASLAVRCCKCSRERRNSWQQTPFI